MWRVKDGGSLSSIENVNQIPHEERAIHRNSFLYNYTCGYNLSFYKSNRGRW